MINDNAKINNGDVRLMVSGGAIANEIPYGVVRSYDYARTNLLPAIAPANWTAGAGASKTTTTSNLFNRDSGPATGSNGIRVSMTSAGGDGFIEERITLNNLQVGIPGQQYFVEFSATQHYEGITHDPTFDGNTAKWTYFVAGETNYWVPVGIVYACDSSGNNKEIISITGPKGEQVQKFYEDNQFADTDGLMNGGAGGASISPWMVDNTDDNKYIPNYFGATAKVFPNNKTHIMVEISLGRRWWDGSKRSNNKPLFTVNSVDLVRNDVDATDPYDPAHRTLTDEVRDEAIYPPPSYMEVQKIDGIDSSTGFTGARYRLTPFLNSTYTYAPKTSDSVIQFETNDWASVRPTGVNKAVIGGTFFSPTTGTGTRIKRVRMGFMRQASPFTAIWGTWISPAGGLVEYEQTVAGMLGSPGHVIVQIETLANKTNPIYADKIRLYYGADLVSGLDFSEYDAVYGYTDVLGKTYELKLSREELGLGILSVGTQDVNLDPVLENGLKQGAEVTLQLNSKLTDAAADTWVNVFSGSITRIVTSYKAKSKVDISMTVTDSYTKLANYPCRWGFATFTGMSLPLTWGGMYSRINGVDHGSGAISVPDDDAVTPQFIDDGMKLVDSVIIARDTASGEAFIDKEDVLILNNPASSKSTKIKFSDTMSSDTQWIPYSINGIDVGFDTTRVINQVTINVQAPAAKYMFINKESYELRGPAAVTIDVANLNSTQATSLASAILNKYELPTVGATKVRYPVRRRQDLALTAGLEIRDKIQVSFGSKLVNKEFYVTKIQMEIKPNRMIVELGFGLNQDGAL